MAEPEDITQAQAARIASDVLGDGDGDGDPAALAELILDDSILGGN